MQVRPANGAARHFDDRVAIVLNDGVVHFLTANVAASVPVNASISISSARSRFA
jgi:hypothetical protein